ncbi:MAG: hypothetical protein IMX02_10520 [Limnochordaceae bacterium]|nr:hypothetical protein [Limnochordaceae bacterium]
MATTNPKHDAAQELATAAATEVRQRPAAPEEVVEEHPRGAMLATLLYLLAIVGAWAYMYANLLSRG